MILYLDSSALVKCYAHEPGSLETIDMIDVADLVATSPITRVEVASALSRAAGAARERSAHREAFETFAEEFAALIQVPVTAPLLAQAQSLVWESRLRGYDAIQLASALLWQTRAREPVTFATFDDRLATAAHEAGLAAWPSQSGNRSAARTPR